MMTTIGDMDKARVTMGSNDSLSKQGARAVMFVFLLAVIMALSAIFVILSSEPYGTAAAERLPDSDYGRSALPKNPAKAPQPSRPEVQSPA
jgi:hypothetical protein